MKLICLLYPAAYLVLFNIGDGLILSAIFYTVDLYTPLGQNLFMINPVLNFNRKSQKEADKSQKAKI